MKNLANCKPSEFLRQTNRIRKSVEKWLTATDIMNIRKRVPQPVKMDPSMTDAEKREAYEGFKRSQEEQMAKNLSAILDAVLEDHPDETLEILALLCFVEPEDADNHTVEEYIKALNEMISNQAVIGFFTSLARLGAVNILN